jgi:hypothetical protein
LAFPRGPRQPFGLAASPNPGCWGHSTRSPTCCRSARRPAELLAALRQCSRFTQDRTPPSFDIEAVRVQSAGKV